MSKFRSIGLRVGLLWLVVLVIWLFLGWLRDAVWGSGYAGYTLAGHMMSAVLATLLTVPLVMAMQRVFDRASPKDIGLRLSADAVRPFLVGVLAWLAPFALGLWICLGAGWVTVTPTANWAEILAFVPLLVVLVFLLEALPEELVFRGYVYGQLASGMSRLWAVVLQAVLFSAWGAALWTISVGTVPIDRIALFFFMGLVLGMVRVVTGSVWASIGLHVAFQTVAQLLLNETRGHFAIVGADMFQFVALGIVPFSLAVMISGIFYKGPHGWMRRAVRPAVS
jgi:membrane protease YdiL (CAAX protease family)